MEKYSAHVNDHFRTHTSIPSSSFPSFSRLVLSSFIFFRVCFWFLFDASFHFFFGVFVDFTVAAIHLVFCVSDAARRSSSHPNEFIYLKNITYFFGRIITETNEKKKRIVKR